MCGISGVFLRESICEPKVISELISYGQLRGNDSFGYSISSYFNNEDKYKNIIHKKYNNNYSNIDVSQDIYKKCKQGDVILMNNRARPETEVNSVESKNIQPIINEEHNIVLVHNGSVSNSIVNELKEKFKFNTQIDSESIIHAYIKFNKNMKATLEYLSGGFAFLMLDLNKQKLYAVCSHGPLWVGYVRGYGMFFNSMEQGIQSVLSTIKGNKVEKNNLSVWEDYYIRKVPEYTIEEIDLPSGQINETKFEPRYILPNFDPYLSKDSKNKEPKVLISASGGLDSSTTLAVLKAAGMNPTAVHFKYGHRGQNAEELAIDNICKILDVELVKFDIQNNMEILDNGMLTNKNIPITTGTEAGLKQTVAWTCMRNGFFTTYMGALAEKLIVNFNYERVYITGGFLQLTESGVYPDNTERFIDSFIKFNKFGSVVGTRVKQLYGLCNLLKTEQCILLNKLGLYYELSPWLVSCDRPMIINDKPVNCSTSNGKPACGSGALSYWATKLSGLKDKRNYYIVNDPNYKLYTPPSTLIQKNTTIEEILKKIMIPKQNLKQLIKKINE